MKRSRTIIILSVALLAPLTETAAVAPLASEELASHCGYYAEDPEGADGIFCVRYIQGFIDGAVATDERVAQNVAAEFEPEQSYRERAFRTRFGRRLARFGPSYFAEFCLGAPVPLKEVVGKVVASLGNADPVPEGLARELVYRTLREAYPCAAQDSGPPAR